MAKKKVTEEEFDEELDDEEEFEEEEFKCRVCGKKTAVDEGDDYILICDDCSENYNMDKIWNDFDSGKLNEDTLKTVDLSKYEL